MQKQSTMRVRFIGLVIMVVVLAAACGAQDRAEVPLQIPNPHHVVVTESIVVNAPVDKVWARVGGFCDITEWMNSPEWEGLQIPARGWRY
jgi:Polyketide cyclase / dehydrase and lipid transport